MPTYYNSTNSPITIEDVRLEARETVTSLKFLLNLPAGVTQTAATPVYNNIIQSTKSTSDATISVPTTYTDTNGVTQYLRGNYKIKIYVGVGECTVKTNAAGSVAKYVGLYDTYELICLDRIIDNVILAISSSTVYTTIELI